MTKYLFKVKYGYGATEFVVVEAGSDLERVLAAWMEKVPVQVGNVFINGRNILSIEPDVHSYTGWNRSYQPKDGDDWRQIERDMPQEIDQVLGAYNQHVARLINSEQHQLIGKDEIDQNLLPAPKK